MKALLDIIGQHKSGEGAGIYSVCSSHPLVIEAAMFHTLHNGRKLQKLNSSSVLIEATSNQVNQDGGYTGMTPQDFCELVYKIANKVNLPKEKIILGGDHLGPNCWQHMGAEDAMDKSDVLIADYVNAGFRKIHLDCSMPCVGDPSPLDDETVASRAARLCAVAEKAWRHAGGEPPVYIVGTEVPVPGGAQEQLDELALTSVEAAQKTIEVHQQAFYKAGLAETWERVIGLVVQPGVEFDNHKVVDFVPTKAGELSQLSELIPHMVYEAHSTDYQSSENLAALVKGHFAILKVGPGLTFAMREAFWALTCIEDEWIPKEQRSNLRSVILEAMRKNPAHWQKYYAEEEHQKLLDCQYSLSDRIRYYWPDKAVEAALEKLASNLDDYPPPATLVSQYMPAQYQAMRAGEISMNTHQLIFHKISEVLEQYSAACHQGRCVQ